MTALGHSIRRRTLVVGLVVASFAGATASAYAAPELAHRGPPGGSRPAKTRTVAKVAQVPKVIVERTTVRCDVPAGTAHPGDLWRCE